MKRNKLGIVGVLFCFFFLYCFCSIGFSQEKNPSRDISSVISQEDIRLSRIPILMLIVEDEIIDQAFEGIFSFQGETLFSKKQEVIELIKLTGLVPGVFSSYVRFKTVLNQKLQEQVGLSPEEARQVIDQVVNVETIKKLSYVFRAAIKGMKVKDRFSPQRIVIMKDEDRQVYDFRNLSEEDISKEEVRTILSNIKIPKSVKRVEGINSKEMISPVALTDKGETVLLKKGVDPSQIKPIMFLRPIQRSAIAHAARREIKINNKEKNVILFNKKKIPVYNLTQKPLILSEVETVLASLDIPTTVKQIEVLVSSKMGDEGASLTDGGETLLFSLNVRGKELVEASYKSSSSRREILERAVKDVAVIELNDDLLTIPAMIAGLDLREVYESFIKEFAQERYDIDINYSSEAIAIAIIRATSLAASFVCPLNFKKALMAQGIEPRVAGLLAQEAVIERVARIILEIRERVLAMSGKKVVVYIDNREVPLLTTGVSANYTPRQIGLAQERLIKERVVLSQVDEIIVVENLQRSLGYTVKSEGKIKAYLSSAVLMDDVIIPPINWMPTMGDINSFEGMSAENTVISTFRPRLKMLLVPLKQMERTQAEIEKQKDFHAYIYKETQGGIGILEDKGKNKVGIDALAQKLNQEKFVIIVEDSVLSAINIDLATWMFGANFVNQAIALEGNGRFRSETDETEYDFTPVAEEFVEAIHRPIIEQNLLIIKDELIKNKGVFIAGMRVVPSADFSIGRMDARLRKIPFNQNQKEAFLHERIVLELGEDLTIALMNGDISTVQLKRVLKGGKVKLAPEEKRKWDRQRKLYQAKIKEGSTFDLFSSDSISKEASKGERMFTAGLNKAFRKSTNWLEDQIEGEENLKEYLISESLDVTFEDLFELDKKAEDRHQVKIAALLKIYFNVQAKNSLIFKKD